MGRVDGEETNQLAPYKKRVRLGVVVVDDGEQTAREIGVDGAGACEGAIARPVGKVCQVRCFDQLDTL